MKRLVLGLGAELEVRLFEEHLAQCNHCFEALQRLHLEDPLLESLAVAGPLVASMPDEAVLLPLLDRLSRLGETAAGERPGDCDEPTDRPQR